MCFFGARQAAACSGRLISCVLCLICDLKCPVFLLGAQKILRRVIRWSFFVYNKYCCCWLERVMLVLELCLDALQVYKLSCLRPASLRLRPFLLSRSSPTLLPVALTVRIGAFRHTHLHSSALLAVMGGNSVDIGVERRPQCIRRRSARLLSRIPMYSIST
jgi:hypothetical protein